MDGNITKRREGNKQGILYSGIKIFVFFSVLFLLLGSVTKLVQRKDSVSKFLDFFDLADQVDVLFFGSSHVINSMNPLQLYAEYGITSYNMAKYGGMVTESYWILMNALDYCEPKCVVVDLWALDRDYQYLDLMDGTKTEEECRSSVSGFHDAIDSWPLTKTKIDTINDLISDYDVKKEFYWDFILYHDRWSSVTRKDFQLTAGKMTEQSYLGATPVSFVVNDVPVFTAENNGKILSDDTVCVQYLYKILEECRSRNIEVIFTFMPVSGYYEEDCWAVNTMEKIAEEEEVLFLNLLPHDKQDVVNFKTDMYDEGHANINGMRKLTSYIGKYLCEVEGVEDHRQDEAYQVWSEKVRQWQSREIEKLLEEKSLYVELGLINNLNANAIIFMPGGSSALQDSIVQELIMQLAGTAGILEAANSGGPYLLIRDATSGTMQMQEFIGEQQIDSFASILGDTNYIGMKDFSAIYVDGNWENNFLDMEEYYNSEAQVIILGQEGEIMSELYYDPVWNDTKIKSVDER